MTEGFLKAAEIRRQKEAINTLISQTLGYKEGTVGRTNLVDYRDVTCPDEGRGTLLGSCKLRYLGVRLKNHQPDTIPDNPAHSML